MDDLDVLARDFGFGSRGKANPMKPQSRDRRGADDLMFSDVFGGQPKYTTSSNSRSTANGSLGGDFDYNPIFKSSAGDESSDFSRSDKATLPVYDKPVYDEDIFDGLPGLKTRSPASKMGFEDDVFASVSARQTAEARSGGTDFDDLLGSFGRGEKGGAENVSSGRKIDSSSKGFDDLLAGFRSGNSPSSRRIPESRWGSVPRVGSKQKSKSPPKDPFVVLQTGSTHHSSSGARSEPLEEIGKFNESVDVKAEVSGVNGGAFDDLDPLSTLGKSSRRDNNGNDERHSDSEVPRSTTAQEPLRNSFRRRSDKFKGVEVPLDRYKESPLFHATNDSGKFGPSASSSPHVETQSNVENAPIRDSVGSQLDDIWLTVSEIPLFTLPSTAPPPSRPPPSLPGRASMAGPGPFSSSFRRKNSEFSTPSEYTHLSRSPKKPSAVDSSVFSQFDELDGSSTGRSESNFDGSVHNSDADMFSASAAAMKDAMNKAEAKFRHAKEVRERENAKASTRKEYGPVENDEDDQDRVEREWRQKEEEEKQRRLESERLKKLENEKARQAVERATREARERAAAQARLKAERDAAEAQERAERAAVQRAQAEARGRAAAEAKFRAEKAAADARQRVEKEEWERAAKAETEARRRAERAAVERVTADARERAATEALQRAAAAARMNQQKNNDLESFFSSGRASSRPRAKTSPIDPFFDQFQGKEAPEVGTRAPSSGGTSSSNMRKVSSSRNVVDDLSSIFGAAPSSEEFQDIEGETEERRKARMERHQRTQERAAKALAEKNQRDLQAQREQEERHRIAEMLDSEIKRWAAGKEGNLRALLSTLQYVLWPECGWQPVSLTELITGASVKKVYRKATLCIHPDKVQQKGATLQQKYIAEKLFDLLKEAWNKFNSEELF